MRRSTHDAVVCLDRPGQAELTASQGDRTCVDDPAVIPAGAGDDVVAIAQCSSTVDADSIVRRGSHERIAGRDDAGQWSVAMRPRHSTDAGYRAVIPLVTGDQIVAIAQRNDSVAWGDKTWSTDVIAYCRPDQRIAQTNRTCHAGDSVGPS